MNYHIPGVTSLEPHCKSLLVLRHPRELNYMSPKSLKLNPISTGEGVFHTPIWPLPVTVLFLSQFPPNLVTFPKM